MRLNGFAVQPPERQPQSPNNRAQTVTRDVVLQDNSKQAEGNTVPAPESSKQRAQRWQSLNTFYDEPPASSRKAMQAYQGIELSERREEVKSMFGVDLYA